jgi:hypothetical protein
MILKFIYGLDTAAIPLSFFISGGSFFYPPGMLFRATKPCFFLPPHLERKSHFRSGAAFSQTCATRPCSFFAPRHPTERNLQHRRDHSQRFIDDLDSLTSGKQRRDNFKIVINLPWQLFLRATIGCGRFRPGLGAPRECRMYSLWCGCVANSGG